MLIGIYYQYIKNYDDALYAYSRLIDVSESQKDYGTYHFMLIYIDTWCKMYHKISKLYAMIGKHNHSLASYKQMLKFSWIGGFQQYEIFAYEGISKWYYYLLELQKSIFYHERYQDARTEPEESALKLRVIRNFNNRFDIKFKSKLRPSTSSSSLDSETRNHSRREQMIPNR